VGLRVIRSPHSLSTDPTTKKPQRRFSGLSLQKTPKSNCTNGFESRPVQISGTTSTYRTLGLRLFEGKASEASRCCKKSTDVRTKRARIIRLEKSVRLAHFGRTVDDQVSRQSPTLPQPSNRHSVNGAVSSLPESSICPPLRPISWWQYALRVDEEFRDGPWSGCRIGVCCRYGGRSSGFRSTNLYG
jgi:hypothetical protein